MRTNCILTGPLAAKAKKGALSLVVAALALVACTGPALGQMTTEQKVQDFQALATSYLITYAPYEWKKQAVNFDFTNLRPWLDRVRASQDDITFFEICTEYVASLQDTHSSFRTPTIFQVTTGLHADVYEGKVLIDSISRASLPVARFPFVVGDEIVTVDGRPVQEVMTEFRKQVASANPRSAARLAAGRLVARAQSQMPRLAEVGTTLRLGIRRQTTGEVENFEIPWIRFGEPLRKAGPVPSPRSVSGPGSDEPQTTEEPVTVPAEEPDQRPAYLRLMRELEQEMVETSPHTDILGYGSLGTMWAFPTSATFQPRPSSFFRVGTFQADGLRIGYIRFANFSPSNSTQALQELETHVQFFNANTDGLVVDVMRNNGGLACYNEEVQRRFIPYPFQGMARELRANRNWLLSFSSSLEAAKANRADEWVVALYTKYTEELQRAFRETRARTGPLPICSPTLERQPANIVYTKPLMVLIDEFSTSAADAFPAVLQDAKRGPLFGYRTNGAGGTTGLFGVGAYSEATASTTIGLHHRVAPVAAPGYPTANYVENVGVQPDIPYDFMTSANLLNAGRPFFDAFSKAIVDHIRANR